MPHRTLIIILLAVITISLVLPGCGRKGDLYLPDASTSTTSDTTDTSSQNSLLNKKSDKNNESF